MVTVRELPSFKQPREKLFEKGVDGLQDYELLAILFRTGYKGVSALSLAKRVLLAKSLLDLKLMQPQALADMKGIGISRAATLLAAFALADRLRSHDEDVVIDTPADVYKVAHHLQKKKQEHLFVLYLNARRRLLCCEVISVGTLTASLVHPREVFAPALEYRAAAVIVVHNHPSGDITPSGEDLTITERLLAAGELLGIEVIDHIIIGDNSYQSLKELGAL